MTKIHVFAGLLKFIVFHNFDEIKNSRNKSDNEHYETITDFMDFFNYNYD
jgi:hypothetical protein